MKSLHWTLWGAACESPFLVMRTENKRFRDLEKGQENKPIPHLSRGGREKELAKAAGNRPNKVGSEAGTGLLG